MDINKYEWKNLTPFSKKVLAYLLFVGLILNCLVLVIPIYSLQVFDRVLTSRSIDTLLLLSGIGLFLLVIQAALDVIKQHFLFSNAARLDAITSSYLYKSLPIQKVENIASQSDVREIKNFITSPAFSSAFDIVWTPIFIGVMFILHPYIGALGLAAVIVVGGFSIYSHKSKDKQVLQLQATSAACRNANNEAQTRQESLNAHYLLEGLSHQYQHITAERIWYEQKLGLTSAKFTSIAKFIRFILQMAVMAVSALLVVNNSMSAGGIIAASILMSRALQPYEQLTSIFQGWKNARDADSRLSQYFAIQAEQHKGTEFDQVQGALHIDNLTWYPPKEKLPLLKNIRLKLEPGNRLLITGSSGSGKTVLCKLLAGIHTPTSGTIKIDGASLNQWDRGQLKYTIGYVPQDIEFLTGSIKQNIACFDKSMTDQQVIRAARTAGVHEDILKLEHGYDTNLGNAATYLAMGLRNGIAIARAIYYTPKIVIMDEPNAHLDTDKLQQFKHLLTQFQQSNIAVVVVSHNQELLPHVDWVVEIQQGQIISAQKANTISKVQNIKKVASDG